MTDEYYIFEDDPPQPPQPKRKRGRGRPRKDESWRWLREPPAHIRNANFKPNIGTLEQVEEMKRLDREWWIERDQIRRKKARNGVRKAYAEGRNTANKIRHQERLVREKRFILYNRDLIEKSHLTASSVAFLAIRRGSNIGYRESKIRQIVATVRSKLPRPNGPKK